jgi:D-aminopeptidase
MLESIILSLFILSITLSANAAEKQIHVNDLGLKIGILSQGKLNAITDVAGVKGGQVTLIKGKPVM